MRLESIILNEDDSIISDKKAVAEKFNNYFIEVIENLDIEHFNGNICNENNVSTNENDEIETIIAKYENHPSILKIKENINVTNEFIFIKPTSESLGDHLISLDPRKSAVENDIPTKILIETKDIIGEYLTNIYHKSIENQSFPLSLKMADVIPAHKHLERSNYRPISLLPSVSKLYERDMYNQILNYMETHLSPYLFGFRKGHSSEQCLNIMLET